MIISFLAIQLQGTLYNYYYVILRNSVKGDSTSRIFENTTPKALNGESQLAVNFFYNIYCLLYIPFDKTIYYMDQNAVKSKPFPKWFIDVSINLRSWFSIIYYGTYACFKTTSIFKIDVPFFIIPVIVLTMES